MSPLGGEAHFRKVFDYFKEWLSKGFDIREMLKRPDVDPHIMSYTAAERYHARQSIYLDDHYYTAALVITVKKSAMPPKENPEKEEADGSMRA